MHHRAILAATSFGLAATLLTLTAGSAQAVDCDVPVLSAYETAVRRGWGFDCPPFSYGNGQLNARFVTFPSGQIGCVVDPPPVWAPANIGMAVNFFSSSSGRPPDLNKGWRVQSFDVDVTRGQWSPRSANTNARVSFALAYSAHPDSGPALNTARLTRLTLSKEGGRCLQAIDEAF